MSDLPKHLSYASDLQAGDKFRVNSSHVWKYAHRIVIRTGFVEIDSNGAYEDYTNDAVFHVQRKPETVEVDKAEYEKLRSEMCDVKKALEDAKAYPHASHFELAIIHILTKSHDD